MKIPNAEGITPIRFNRREMLMIVLDDGNMPELEGAHYLLPSYEDLNIDPMPDP